MPRRPNRQERGLDLLRSETNRAILVALARTPSTEAELTGWLVLRARGKLRRHLDTLLAAGAIESRRLRGMRRRVEYRLTDIGTGLVAVISAVEGWLRSHPERDLETVSPVGWRAFALLVDAWSAGVLQALARGPTQLVELAAATGISAARLGDDLVALEGAGVVDPCGSTEGRASHELTAWGIRGIGVLALGRHWQPRIGEPPTPVSVDHALVALGAALTLVRLPDSESGICTLTVERDDQRGSGRHSGGLRVTVAAGRVEAIPASAGQGATEAWVRGKVDEWLAALVAGRMSALYVGGRREMAEVLLAGVHTAVYDQSVSRDH